VADLQINGGHITASSTGSDPVIGASSSSGAHVDTISIIGGFCDLTQIGAAVMYRPVIGFGRMGDNHQRVTIANTKIVGRGYRFIGGPSSEGSLALVEFKGTVIIEASQLSGNAVYAMAVQLQSGMSLTVTTNQMFFASKPTLVGGTAMPAMAVIYTNSVVGPETVDFFGIALLTFSTFAGNVLELVCRPVSGTAHPPISIEFNRAISGRLCFGLAKSVAYEIQYYVQSTGETGKLCFGDYTTSSLSSGGTVTKAAYGCTAGKLTQATKTSKPRTPFPSPTATIDAPTPEFTTERLAYSIRRKFRRISLFTVALVR
jgi:hypothetical protein